MLYKIIVDNKIVGVSNDDGFRFFQKKNCLILYGNADNAQYVECNDVYYHDDWLRPIENEEIEYVSAKIVRIEEDEYNSLLKDLELEEEIEVYEEESAFSAEVIEEREDGSLEAAKASKIKELNFACRKEIEKGVDVELYDGSTHHFSMTSFDQINLSAAMEMFQGNTNLKAAPYHADKEAYKYYSKNDLNRILSAANQHRIWHLAYVNGLKLYVQSLENADQISEIEYGITLPSDWKNEVLKSIEKE